MGRKPIPEHEKKKERRLYLTDAEWERLQKYVWKPGMCEPMPCREDVEDDPEGWCRRGITISTFDPDAEGVG